MAEGVGFEPTRATRTPLVFETSALNRSAIPPPTRKTGYRSTGDKATSTKTAKTDGAPIFLNYRQAVARSVRATDVESDINLYRISALQKNDLNA